MIAQQAKQQPPEHLQQQQLPPRRQHQRQQEDVVAVEDSWNRQQRLNGENNEIAEYNRRCAISDEWTISNLATDNLKINKNQESRNNCVGQVAVIREEATSPRLGGAARSYGEVAAGSNGESTQCSDIEDDDDVEIEEEVDDVDTDEDDDDDDNKEIGNRAEKSDYWIKKKVVTTKVQHQTSFGGSDGQSEVVPHLDETTFGEVCITNSKHVHVGNTNFYKGPVTIKQFVYTNAYPILDKEDTVGNSSARASDINPNDVPIGKKCNLNGPILPSSHDYDAVTKWLWTWRCAAILCVLSLVTIAAVVLVLLTRNTGVPPDPGSEEPDPPAGSVRIIEREFWNAQPPSKELEKLEESPTPYVIISHTATEACTTQSACVFRVRLIQTLHIESFGWDDIGYNFLIGGDGLAYRGRGWNLAGAHAFGYNFNSIGISFIGTFNDVAPSRLQLHTALRLIELGVNITKISPSYKLLGHRQVSKTLSPGEELYKILQTWEHWSPLPRPESNRATTANRPHTAAILPLIINIVPYLLILIQRSFWILFRPLFCNTYGLLEACFTNHDKIRTIK